ncbi:MAG: hypothetical protein Q7S37_03330 [bacterium]|nr:hypothetical protein [bacterium]
MTVETLYDQLDEIAKLPKEQHREAAQPIIDGIIAGLNSSDIGAISQASAAINHEVMSGDDGLFGDEVGKDMIVNCVIARAFVQALQAQTDRRLRAEIIESAWEFVDNNFPGDEAAPELYTALQQAARSTEGEALEYAKKAIKILEEDYPELLAANPEPGD